MSAPYLTWGETKGTWDTDVALQTDVVLHQSDLSKVRDTEEEDNGFTIHLAYARALASQTAFV